MGRPGERGKRISPNGLYSPELYKNGHVYIVDDVDPDAPVKTIMGKEKVDSHTYKCDLIRELFTKHSNFEVHSVRFRKGAKGKDAETYWQRELQSKTRDDLLIIFFHGKAGGEDEEYKWTLTQYPKIAMNAYKLIDMFTRCDADSLVLLDCFLQTNLSESWSRIVGNTEIIMRPECMQSPDGKVMEHDGDFTEVMVDIVSKYIKKVKKNGRHAMITIPEIMSRDETMYSKTQRTWLSRTRYGDDTPVFRIKLDPNRIRADEKLVFCSVQIQGDQVARGSEAEALLVQAAFEAEQEAKSQSEDGEQNNLFDDETFGDDDNMSTTPNAESASESGDATGDETAAYTNNGADVDNTEEDGTDLFLAP